MVEVQELSSFKRPHLERTEKQVSFQVASQHCFTVATVMSSLLHELITC